jgi:purine-binding chemotaxis protein CheW
VVDAVSEVLNIPTTGIQPPPDFGREVDAGFIRGMTKAGDKLVVVLDTDRILGVDAATGLPDIVGAARETGST